MTWSMPGFSLYMTRVMPICKMHNSSNTDIVYILRIIDAQYAGLHIINMLMIGIRNMQNNSTTGMCIFANLRIVAQYARLHIMNM